MPASSTTSTTWRGRAPGSRSASRIGLGDHPCSEGMPQVVEAQRAQAGTTDRREVAPAQGAAVLERAGRTDEDQVVVSRPPPAPPESGKRGRDVRRHRHGPHLARLRGGELALGVAGAHADHLAGEVDVAPAQSEQLAAAQAGERSGEEDRGVLLGRGRADQRHHLLGREHLDVTAAARRRLRDVGGRVQPQAIELARPLEDAVHQNERLRARARRPGDTREPALDHRRRDRLDRLLAEDRKQLRAHERAVARDRRGLALAVVLDVAQPLGGRVGEVTPVRTCPGSVPRRA